VSEIIQVLGAMGRGRLAAMGLVVGDIIIFFIYMTMQMTAPRLTLLYGDLEPGDSAEILGRLNSLGVPYEIKANGGTIMVPTKQVANLRMTLAAEGIPSGGVGGV